MSSLSDSSILISQQEGFNAGVNSPFNYKLQIIKIIFSGYITVHFAPSQKSITFVIYLVQG